MAILHMELEAHQLVLGRFLGPGTPYRAIGVIEPRGQGFDCLMEIDAPDAVVDRIRAGYLDQYGVHLALEPADGKWRAHFSTPDRNVMQTPLLAALNDINDHLVRYYGSVEGGILTAAMESDLPVVKLQRTASKLRAFCDAHGLNGTSRVSDRLELPSYWNGILQDAATT